LYHSLLPPQRQQLLAGRPLPARSLTPAQQAMLVHIGRGQKGSMIGMFMGAKPKRRPEELAQAAITLEGKDLDAGQSRTPPVGAASPEADIAAPSVSYTFRLTFPNGQKDEYTLLATRAAPQLPPARRAR